MTARAGMTPDDIPALVDVADPRVSPDGRTIAYVVTTIDGDENVYRSRVWLAAADGGSSPVPFTAGEHRDCRPRWSPDGRRVAFVSHREGKGSGLHVLPVAGGGEAVRVATMPEEIDEVEWSPDGTRLGFVCRLRDESQYGPDKDGDRPPRRITRLNFRLDSVGWTSDRPRQLFVVPADGSSKPLQLTDSEAGAGGVSWSPDGTTIAFASARHDTWDLDQYVDLWTVAATGGPAQQLTATGKGYGRPSFSPGGSTVAFTRGDPDRYPGHGQVGVIDDAGGEPRLLTTSLDRQCTPFLPGSREPVWDGDRLLFLVEDAGNTHLYAVASDGGEPQLLVGGDREVKAFDMAGGTLAFCASSPTELPELFVLEAGKDRQLTSAGAAFVVAHELVAPERFTAVSPDGSEIEAWIMRPAGFEAGHRYPTLLNIHGGPFTQYGNRFFDEFQMQVGAGYAVVYANPRGSSGYSNAFAQAICGKDSFAPGTGWGGADYEDLMAVCDEALHRFDFIDVDRFGVLGGSYGGYMTNWIISHSDRFKAACAERSVTNHLSFCGTSDIGVRFPKCYIGPSHLEDPEEYLRQSPITYVRDIATPVLLLHSENDLRCPIEQTEQLFVALKMLGRDVEFVRFPGESHELSRAGSPKHRVQRMALILEYFDRKLR